MPAIRTLPPQPTTRNERREHDPPEAELRQPDRRGEVEHVPREPEDERSEQDQHDEHREGEREAARDERADPEHAQQRAEAACP